MELKHLVSYATVVRLGSFSRAAEELFIAQPTISLHVRQLEEELQTRLLLRTTKSLGTASGESFGWALPRFLLPISCRRCSRPM